MQSMCGKTEDTVVLYSYLVTHGCFPLSLLYIIMHYPKKLCGHFNRESAWISPFQPMSSIFVIKQYLFSYILCLLSFSTCRLSLCSLATCILSFCILSFFISSLVNNRRMCRMKCDATKMQFYSARNNINANGICAVYFKCCEVAFSFNYNNGILIYSIVNRCAPFVLLYTIYVEMIVTALHFTCWMKTQMKYLSCSTRTTCCPEQMILSSRKTSLKYVYVHSYSCLHCTDCFWSRAELFILIFFLTLCRE